MILNKTAYLFNNNRIVGEHAEIDLELKKIVTCFIVVENSNRGFIERRI